MHFDESADVWRYDDDGTKVSDGWRDRPCGKCGEAFVEDGHDPCIANLPGVMNACCGHGYDTPYVQFWDDSCVRGVEALEFQRNSEAMGDGTEEVALGLVRYCAGDASTFEKQARIHSALVRAAGNCEPDK